MNSNQGIFITFEGGEGVGKSTHIGFLSELLQMHGREVLCVREPGGTSIGEALRRILLDPENENMSDEAELLLYEAARAQIVAEVIRPALDRGAVVLCDRFYDSTVAYQSYGRGLPKGFVEAANDFACNGVHPDKTILMICDGGAKTGLQRATHHGQADRVELAGEAFHERVNAGFARIAAENPERICVVASSDAKTETAKKIMQCLSDVFPWLLDDPRECDVLFEKLETGFFNNKKPAALSGVHVQEL